MLWGTNHHWMLTRAKNYCEGHLRDIFLKEEMFWRTFAVTKCILNISCLVYLMEIFCLQILHERCLWEVSMDPSIKNYKIWNIWTPWKYLVSNHVGRRCYLNRLFFWNKFFLIVGERLCRALVWSLNYFGSLKMFIFGVGLQHFQHISCGIHLFSHLFNVSIFFILENFIYYFYQNNFYFL